MRVEVSSIQVKVQKGPESHCYLMLALREHEQRGMITFSRLMETIR